MARFYGNYNNHRGNQGKNNQKGPKTPPYNFIEPNKRVFYPQDFGEVSDDKISFEKPFSDFQSGILDIKITAKSDIFIGAFTDKNADTQTPKDFFKIGENYALSGSSVRGVIRTIAEVLSYAKFHTNAPDYKDKKGNVTERFKSNFDKNESRLDMVERIFGVVAKSKNAKVQALKSRISFSHFIASEVRPATQKHIKYILMSPDAATTKGLKDKNGFRFYAPLGKITPTNAAKAKNDKVISTISPLGKGSVFVGKLRYFNLTKSELGLLLFCLTALRDDKGECYKFGGAKFYGYGDARIEIKGIDEGLKNECINAYKSLLKKANFEVESRIESLRKVSKLQSTTTQIQPTTNYTNPTNTTQTREYKDKNDKGFGTMGAALANLKKQ